MATARIVFNTVIGGMNMPVEMERTESGLGAWDPTAANGTAGTVTSGTTSRLLTLASGHGITDSELVDVYWTASGVPKVRYGMTVTAYDSTTVTVTAASGGGDAFPANGTTLDCVSIQSEEAVQFPNTGLAVFCATSDKRCCICFRDLTDAVLLVLHLAGGDAALWVESTVATNPFSDTVESATVSCGDPTTDAAIKIGVVYDPSP